MGDFKIVPLGELRADPLGSPKTTLFFHQAQGLELQRVTLGVFGGGTSSLCHTASLSKGLSRWISGIESVFQCEIQCESVFQEMQETEVLSLGQKILWSRK